MPQRQSQRTIRGGVQGEDAELVILIPTVGEQNAFFRDSIAIASTDPLKSEQVARAYYARHVLSFNWVDADGAPLPQIHNNPDAIDALTAEEGRFIFQALQGQLPEQVAEKKV